MFHVCFHHISKVLPFRQSKPRTSYLKKNANLSYNIVGYKHFYWNNFRMLHRSHRSVMKESFAVYFWGHSNNPLHFLSLLWPSPLSPISVFDYWFLSLIWLELLNELFIKCILEPNLVVKQHFLLPKAPKIVNSVSKCK